MNAIPTLPSPGLLYAFLSAGDGVDVTEVQEVLNRTWIESRGLSVLSAEFPVAGGHSPGIHERNGIDVLASWPEEAVLASRVLEGARGGYDIVSVNLTSALTSAPGQHTFEILRNATSIFVVADSRAQSLETAAETVGGLTLHHLEERCGLLLKPVAGGLDPDQAEERTGIPVCGLVGTGSQLQQLAAWLSSSSALRLAGAL
jgi:hypothetical protein